MGAAVQAAPLLALATVVPTDTGGDLSLGYIVTQATSNEIEIDGAAITAADPTFGVNTVLGAYAYKNLSQFSTEFVTDAAFNFEQFAADRIAPGAVRQLSADMVGRQRFVGPSRPLGRPHHCRSSRPRSSRSPTLRTCWSRSPPHTAIRDADRFCCRRGRRPTCCSSRSRRDRRC